MRLVFLVLAACHCRLPAAARSEADGQHQRRSTRRSPPRISRPTTSPRSTPSPATPPTWPPTSTSTLIGNEDGNASRNRPRPGAPRPARAAPQSTDAAPAPAEQPASPPRNRSQQIRRLGLGQARQPCAPAATGAIAAAPSPARSPHPSPPRLSAQSIGWTRKWPKSQPSSSSRSIPSCGHTSFSSSPWRWTTSVPLLGLMHSQSMPGTRRQRAVALDRDPEAAAVQRVDQRRVELQHRLAAGDDDQPALARLAPQRLDMTGQSLGVRELAAAGAVGADEIGVAEIALGGRRGPLRAPTTDCSRRSAGTPRGGPTARLRPAGSGRLP